jgi:hypothetical protein
MTRLSRRADARKLDPCPGLRRLYSAPEWSLHTQVRTSTGDVEVLRTADAIAVRMWGDGWHLHGFEAKVSRADWLHELRRPEKAGPLKLFCSSWWLVVPAPWKHVVLALSELPDRWGLIEVGTGAPCVVVKAAERQAEEPTPGFLRALLRASSREDDALEEDAPRVLVNRPHLSRSHVGLACGHVAPRPGDKVLPRALPCWACAEGLPSDREMVEAAIDDASEDELRALAARIEARLPRAA